MFGLATLKNWNSIELELDDVVDYRSLKRVDEACFMTDRTVKRTKERISFVYTVGDQGVRGDFCRYGLAHEEK